jgi:hypothetical protein
MRWALSKHVPSRACSSFPSKEHRVDGQGRQVAAEIKTHQCLRRTCGLTHQFPCGQVPEKEFEMAVSTPERFSEGPSCHVSNDGEVEIDAEGPRRLSGISNWTKLVVCAS